MIEFPKEKMGKHIKQSLTKTQPRKWTSDEEDFVIQLKDQKISNKNIGDLLGRTPESIQNKVRRLKKRNGTYNDPHRPEKYSENDIFLSKIKPTSVLDVFSGYPSYYDGKVPQLITNDKKKCYDTTYNLPCTNLLQKLYSENMNFDIVDLDPFGLLSDENIKLAMSMSKKGLIVTFSEKTSMFWGRIDVLKPIYGIDNCRDLKNEHLINRVLTIGKELNKKIIVDKIGDWGKSITRIYFKIL